MLIVPLSTVCLLCIQVSIVAGVNNKRTDLLPARVSFSELMTTLLTFRKTIEYLTV